MADERSTEYRRYNATTNISYILSQMTDVAVRLVRQRFPRDFFQSVTVLSEDQAVREQRRLEENLRTEFQRPNPALSVNPSYVLDNSLVEPNDPWMHMATRQGKMFELVGKYPHVFSDMENERALFTLPKRHKATFEVAIRVESQQQGWDVLSFLKHGYLFDSYFYITGESMAAVIPNITVLALASSYGLNPLIEPDRTQFTALMDEHTRTFVSDVVDPAKKKSYYMFRFVQNILTRMSMPSADYSRRGQEARLAEIRFGIEMEASLPTNYAVECKDSKDSTGELLDGMEKNFYPTIRINAFRIPPLLEMDGKKLVFHKGFITDAPNTSGFTERSLDDTEVALGEVADLEFTGDPPVELAGPLEVMRSTPGDEFSRNEWLPLDAGSGDVPVITQRVRSVDGAWVLRMKLDLKAIAEPYTLSAVASTSEPEVSIGFKVEGYAGARLRLNDPDIMHHMEVDFSAPSKDPWLYIALPDDSRGADIDIASLSVKRLLRIVHSTSRDDILYLSEVMAHPVKVAVAYSLEHGEDPGSYLMVHVVHHSLAHEPVPQEDLSMDWETMALTIRNPLFNSTHYVSIYANMIRFKAIHVAINPEKAADYRTAD